MTEWIGYRFAPSEGTFLSSFAQNQQLVIEDYRSEPNRVRVKHVALDLLLDNLDPIETHFRKLRPTDVVHESVTSRDGCNNPAAGCGLVSDTGEPRGTFGATSRTAATRPTTSTSSRATGPTATRGTWSGWGRCASPCGSSSSAWIVCANPAR